MKMKIITIVESSHSNNAVCMTNNIFIKIIVADNINAKMMLNLTKKKQNKKKHHYQLCKPQKSVA